MRRASRSFRGGGGWVFEGEVYIHESLGSFTWRSLEESEGLRRVVHDRVHRLDGCPGWGCVRSLVQKCLSYRRL